MSGGVDALPIGFDDELRASLEVHGMSEETTARLFALAAQLHADGFAVTLQLARRHPAPLTYSLWFSRIPSASGT